MPGGFSQAGLARLTASLHGYVGEQGAAGVVTLLYRRGEIAHCAALGWRDAEQRLPAERDTLFRIASMTKPVTSAALLLLVEAGQVQLDDRIDRWLPELAAPRVLRNPVGALDDTEPLRRPITVLDLLTHRAGLAYPFTATGPLAAAYQQLVDHRHDNSAAGAWLQSLAALPLMLQPGTRWHYSVATDVLGILVARVAGMTLGEFMRTRIFEPLGMTDTAFVVPPAKLGRLAAAYAVDAASGARVLEDAPGSSRWAEPQRFESGGGGLVSSADDYLRFARLLLGRGRVGAVRLLSPKSVDLMRANFLSAAERRIPTFGEHFWAGQGFGLGLAVVDDVARRLPLGYRSLGSFGWDGAFGTTWLADPVEDMVAIMLIQRRCTAPFAMARDFERDAYAAIDD
jgi:CubicO group peptidase (beta-lactamase class C family)